MNIKSTLIAVSFATLALCGIGSANEASLTTTYTRMMEELKSELLQEIPEISSSKVFAFNEAARAVGVAKEKLKNAEARKAAIFSAEIMVKHARFKWIAGADKKIAKAKKDLKTAKSSTEREKAKEDLEKWQQDRANGVVALQERMAKWEALKDDKPEIEKEIEEAEVELETAKTRVLQATKNLELTSFLSSDKLDGKLARYVALKEATPEALAKYASQGPGHERRIDELLSNDELLTRIALADGPARNEESSVTDYGRMMEIYENAIDTSQAESSDTLERLSLAVALEHAAPIKMMSAVSETDAPEFVDPLKRYLHYEKAYLSGELDPHFDDLTVWEMRMVVGGEEPDKIISWGRKMLKNYRPDHITTSNDRWRYVALVRTDVRYVPKGVEYKRDNLHLFQNILSKGGNFEKHALFGRFILRAFGIPNTARPQHRHSALVRWTLDGWVPALGREWGSGWTETPYGHDLDFLATTQARALGPEYLRVKRAHWIADLMDEPRVWGLLKEKERKEPGFWNTVALYTQRALIADSRPASHVTSSADASGAIYSIGAADITEAPRHIRIADGGVITIPAAATVHPTDSKGRILFTTSALGGLQMHYQRAGRKTGFDYLMDAPEAGYYNLVCKVVSPGEKQNLVVSVNDQKNATVIPLPHTVGLWDYTKPVQVELKKGKNLIRFSHRADGNDSGFSIKEFQLTPLTVQLSR